MRARLLNHAKANFRTLDAAEEQYKLTLRNYLEEMEQSRDSKKRMPVKVVDKVTQTLSGEQTEIHDVAESKNPMKNGINSNPAMHAMTRLQDNGKKTCKVKIWFLFHLLRCSAPRCICFGGHGD